jgi:hypothetical protein
MSYKTVHDVLTCLQKHYAKIAAALDEAEFFANSADEEAAVNALRHDERRVAEAMGDSANNGSEKTNQTWLQYVPSERVQESAEELLELCENGGTIEQLEQTKLEFDEAVQDFVRTIAEQVNAPSVRERLDSLAEYFASRARQESWSQRRE